MVLVDVIVVLVLIGALIGGIRRGFFASLGTLAGVVVGALLAYWLVPLASTFVPLAQWRGIAIVGASIVLVLGGAVVGGAVGGAIRRGADKLRLRWLERVLGGALSLCVAALALALVGQTVTAAGMPGVSSAVASSRVLQTIDRFTPTPVATALAQVRSAVLDDGLPTFGALLQLDTSVMPAVELDDEALSTAAQSVARVSGVAYACGTSATGSGFVVSPGLVMTNAHVVAGVETAVVEFPGVSAQDGRIVYFDAIHDVAIISVDRLNVPALALVPTPAVATSIAVQGYPYGGPFTQTSGHVTSVGDAPVSDIYGESTAVRGILAVSATVQPGNSGGPVLTADGDVAGLVFAKSDSNDSVGYALTTAEILAALATVSTNDSAVSTGGCVS